MKDMKDMKDMKESTSFWNLDRLRSASFDIHVIAWWQDRLW
jgi:hypothetical protein